MSLFIMLAVILTAYGHSHGWSNWELFCKVAVGFSAITCVAWWFWAMKKIREVAQWWGNLNDNMERANQLLAEAQAELHEIKALAKSS
jgi:hypothetical protein